MEAGGDVSGSTAARIKNLHSIYVKYVRPLEDMYKYDIFRPSWFEETLLNPRPFVSFFGPWSSGKTTFINYLLQNNYLWTGPQPTTAHFTVIVHGKEAGSLDGRVLANAKHLPFRGLDVFGDSFLQNFKGFQAPHPLLEKVTLIDTPGVLEGTKGFHERQYDYVKVCRWFVERSDMVFFLFDPAKLDSGNELRQVFTEALRGQESKLRIILNKADTIDTQALMRVYGSLFWNLSNIMSATEPPRVYVGSFWDQPYKEGVFTLLLSEEKKDLLHELIDVIPQQAYDKKIAQLIRRAKDVLTHAAIVGSMKSDLPVLFFKDKAKKKALQNLPKTYEVVGAKYKLNHNDFPPVSSYLDFLAKYDVEKFPEIEKAEKRGLIAGIRECIDTILPAMLTPVQHYGPSDPRNTAEVDSLKRRYYDSIKAQCEGKAGIQGSTDLVATASRPVATECIARVDARAPVQSRPSSDTYHAAQQQPRSTSQADPVLSSGIQPSHQNQLTSQLQQSNLQAGRQKPVPSTFPAAPLSPADDNSVVERMHCGGDDHTSAGDDSDPATVAGNRSNSSVAEQGGKSAASEAALWQFETPSKQ